MIVVPPDQVHVASLFKEVVVHLLCCFIEGHIVIHCVDYGHRGLGVPTLQSSSAA